MNAWFSYFEEGSKTEIGGLRFVHNLADFYLIDLYSIYIFSSKANAFATIIHFHNKDKFTKYSVASWGDVFRKVDWISTFCNKF